MPTVNCSCGEVHDSPDGVGFCIMCKKEVCNACAEPGEWIDAIQGVCTECFEQRLIHEEVQK